MPANAPPAAPIPVLAPVLAAIEQVVGLETTGLLTHVENLAHCLMNRVS
jgi:hypothetical protein